MTLAIPTETASGEDDLTALFFSALPYRRVIFRRGGWPPLFPDPAPWNTFRPFLRIFWSRAEVSLAETRSRRFLEARGPRSSVLFGGKGYPCLLARVYDPPPALFFRGAPVRGDWDFLAVVGTRRPDRISLEAVDRLALRIRDSSSLSGLLRSCVESVDFAGMSPIQPSLFPGLEQKESAKGGTGVFVGTRKEEEGSPLFCRPGSGAGPSSRMATVSGFAFGVDERIHGTSLRCRIPTVAVLGSGIDRITPTGNAYLVEEAARTGASLTFFSEFFPDEMPRSFSYPRRNRIIAGMAPVCFVIQAGRESGAMITARYALEEGRDISAFDHPDLAGPGKNEGARQLLADGAGRLVLFSASGA